MAGYIIAGSQLPSSIRSEPLIRLALISKYYNIYFYLITWIHS